MEVIGVTLADIIPHEERVLISALEGCDSVESPLYTLHMRKLASSTSEVAQLLRKIPRHLHSKIVIHDHFELLGEFDFAAIHLNSRHPTPPAGYCGEVTRAAHSLEKLSAGGAKYTWLSPIFNSVSKVGYMSNFNIEELRQSELINERVVALGGVTPENILKLKGCRFGGVALLGYLWAELEPKAVLERLNLVDNAIKKLLLSKI